VNAPRWVLASFSLLRAIGSDLYCVVRVLRLVPPPLFSRFIPTTAHCLECSMRQGYRVYRSFPYYFPHAVSVVKSVFSIFLYSWAFYFYCPFSVCLDTSGQPTFIFVFERLGTRSPPPRTYSHLLGSFPKFEELSGSPSQLSNLTPNPPQFKNAQTPLRIR